MNKNKFSFLVFLFALLLQTSALSSQSLQTVPRVGLGISGLDFSVEFPVAENITIEPAIGFGPSYDFYNEDAFSAYLGWHWAILEPSVHVSTYGKFFYNRDKRMLKGKSMKFNSGNFFGVKVKYVSKPLTNYSFDQDNTLLANLNWGGQRNFGRYWSYSYSVGVGCGSDIGNWYTTFYPAIDLKVSYVLPLLIKKGR